MLAFLYALATLVLTVYGLNLLWLSIAYVRKSRLREGPVPEPDALPPRKEPWPDVTVQLPLYNEPLVAERLIDACAQLQYPTRKLEIQVLDDSTDETVQIVANRVAYWRTRGIDVIHIHRENRTGYKAGALKNGLMLARGEFIAIFDADFLPPPRFLLTMIPYFDEPAVGMVQGRWGHINAEESLLTRIQAFGLDAHFALEQFVRNRAGYFMNFNGTAGVWRRACIEDAGDWHSDTLAEDLDLSYRAQLNGWLFRFIENVEVPAELPFDITALRTQQYRWTKGAAEVALKLLKRIWRSPLPWDVKVEGSFHLTAPFVFPFVLLVALLHPPLLILDDVGLNGPSELYFGLLGIGLLGFAGFFLAQVFAQRALYPDWFKRVCFFPLFMAGTMGMALSNTGALLHALRGKKTAFVRTPKYNTSQHHPLHQKTSQATSAPRDTPQQATSQQTFSQQTFSQQTLSQHATLRESPVQVLGYAPALKPAAPSRPRRRIPAVVWLEAVLAVYCTSGLGAIIMYGEWAAVPFQVLFALGFGLITVFNIQHLFLTSKA